MAARGTPVFHLEVKALTMQSWAAKLLAYLSGTWRYRWFGLAAAWAICAIGWGIVAFIPDRYTVEAKVFIDTDSLMGPLLKGLAVPANLDERVGMMLKTLITRPNIEQVIHIVNPKSASFTAARLEKQVDEMEANVTIRPLESKNLFAIGYSDNNSAHAEAVTQTLLSILIDSNIGDKRRDMEGVQSFIDRKIAQYETDLRAAEKRRADFKAANLDLVETGTEGTDLDKANAQVVQANQDLGAAIVQRDSFAAQLAVSPKTVALDRGTATEPDSTLAGGSTLRGSPSQRLEQAKQSLVELRAKFTDDYPDIVATKKTISQLEAEIAAAPKKASADSQLLGNPNPIYVELRGKLSDAEASVALQRHRVAEATSNLERAKESTAHAIEIEAKYKDLDRDYGIINDNYQQLLKSREAARLSQSADDQQQAVSFRVVEPPQRSPYPAAPNRLLLNSLVLLAGVAGGVAAALLLSLNAGQFAAGDELAAMSGMPLIGVVTRLQSVAEWQRTRFAIAVLSASVGLLLLCYAAVLAVLSVSIYSRIGI